MGYMWLKKLQMEGISQNISLYSWEGRKIKLQLAITGKYLYLKILNISPQIIDDKG